MLTQNQSQLSIDVGPLLNTTVDCLRFVTEFFDVIRQSGPHIYHSALLLAPQSSIVHHLYCQQINSPVTRVLNGFPASWDSCIASAGTEAVVEHAVWSPCGQSVAVGFGDTVQVQDSNTLERLSALKHSGDFPQIHIPLVFSPNGKLLACIWRSVSCFLHIDLY